MFLIIFRLCLPGTLSRRLVRGKIVFCWWGSLFEAVEVQRAGGVAAILGNPYDGEGILQCPFVFPGLTLLLDDKYTVLYYIWNNTNPTAKLIPGKTTDGNFSTTPASAAPFMAPFTSVGPNWIEPNILKVTKFYLSQYGGVILSMQIQLYIYIYIIKINI